MRRSRATVVASALAVFATAGPGYALDKQGSAHGGDLEGGGHNFDVEGALMMGVSLFNPSYGARPDNSGRALMRYAAHVDVDLIGRRLSLPLDVNVFTDRMRSGLGVFAPTELDMIGGVTSTWEAGPGAFEFGSRVEHDRPVDLGGFTQTYVDVRTRYVYSLAKLIPPLGPGLRDGDISGWLTLGMFAHNPTYAARPDNTGIALMRYAAHAEVSVVGDLISFGLDATMFTDRRKDALRPSELDFTQEIILHLAPYEFHLAYEVDRPVDRSGLIQQFVYVLAAWNFDLRHDAAKPMEDRGQVLSP